MKYILRAAVLVSLSLSFTQGYALEVETHKAINEHIARNTVSDFSLDAYLKNYLGVQEGVEKEYKYQSETQKAWRWLTLGGLYEDVPYWYLPYLRSVNHFHNPITNQGVSGLLSGESAVTWAQKPAGTQSPGGFYSWNDVRGYYYNALVSTAKEGRNANFAETFRGIGQLMHLVQDMSVPAHTRNDTHIVGYHYEKAVEKFRKSGDAQVRRIYYDALASPVTFDPSIFTLPSNSLAPIPIAKIFDADKYDGSTPLSGVDIGLAEYTNANFFSEDTITSPEFPFPSKNLSNYVQCADTAPPGSWVRKRWYLSRTSCPADSQQGSVDHFLTWSFLPSIQSGVLSPAMRLDDNVYMDYVKQLLPRAVGYSAGLLKYFFRGKLAVSPVDDYSVKVYNFSDEPLNSGVLELYYDDEQDNRHWCGTLTVQSPITMGKDSGPISLVPMPPTNNKHPGRYLAVFKGILGGEEGSVVGSFGFDWWEEWDNGLNGNHPWIYINGSRYDLNKGNGKVENAVESGNLRKKNIRYAGSSKQQVNESYIGENYKNDQGQYCIGRYCVSNDFGWEFPIQVTNRTWLTLKIDKMSGPDLPSLNCTVYDYDSNITTYYENSPAAFQHVNLVFRVGDGTSRVLEFTVNGQQSEQNKWVDFPLGKIKSYYLFNILKQLGPVIEPVWLDHISVRQWMPLACDAPATDQVQEMEIDHISIFDAHSVDGTLYEFDNVLPPSATSSRLIIVP